MRPISFLSETELEKWGCEQLECLIGHFGYPQTHKWTDQGNEEETTSKPLIEPEATRIEWKQLKPRVLAQMYPRDNTVNLWSLVNEFHKEEFPNILKLAKLSLVCPVHTAGCERGFSAQNSVLTPLRNRLTCETQDKLLRVKIEGGVLCKFGSEDIQGEHCCLLSKERCSVSEGKVPGQLDCQHFSKVCMLSKALKLDKVSFLNKISKPINEIYTETFT